MVEMRKNCPALLALDAGAAEAGVQVPPGAQQSSGRVFGKFFDFMA
jgi:hypothetical protein